MGWCLGDSEKSVDGGLFSLLLDVDEMPLCEEDLVQIPGGVTRTSDNVGIASPWRDRNEELRSPACSGLGAGIEDVCKISSSQSSIGELLLSRSFDECSGRTSGTP